MVQPEVPPERGALEAWLVEAVERWGVPGAAIAIRRGGELAHAEAGVIALGDSRPVEPDTLFQVGSTTKVMTAALLLQLVDEGTLDIDSTLGEWFEAFVVGRFDASGVTVRQLLAHTSGLPGHHFADFGPGVDSIARYVSSLSEQSMIHPPGEMFSYCNGGYVVAGRVAEIATGVPFADLVRARLAEALGLGSTAIGPAGSAGGELAVGHDVDAEGRHRRSEPQFVAWSSAPAGSVTVSTAIELAHIGHTLSGAHSESSLLSGPSIELMTSPSVELPCRYWGRQSQCLGWGHDVRGATEILLHGGGTTGHSAMLLAIPEDGVTVALLTNSAQGAGLLGDAERWLLSQLDVPTAREPPPAGHELTDEEMDQLVGTYSDIWTTTTVRREAEGLMLDRRIHRSAVSPELELPAVRLEAIGPRLVTTGAGRPMLFLGPDGSGRGPAAYLHQLNASRRVAE